MYNTRERFLETIIKYRFNPDEPGNAEYWSPELDTAPRNRLREIQSEKLLAAVQYVYKCSPFYHVKFDAIKLKPADIKGVDDLWKIPVTTKTEMARDVVEHPPWGTYSPIDDALWSRRGWMLFTSSGTTAQPRPFRYTLFDRDMWAWADARSLWAMGVRPGDKAFLAFGYGPFAAFWGFQHGLNRIGVPAIPGGALDSKRRAYFIHTFQPTVLVATPSYCLFLGSVMQEMGYEPAKSSIRLIVSGGEPGVCIPATKRRIESLWGASLHEMYGCTEAAPSAGGCLCHAEVQNERPSTHLLEDCQIWETVDPDTLQPVPPGQRGLTVATNLISEGSPQLRFLVGDFATFTEERCACGMTHVRAIGGFQGRADDMINIRGLTVFPSAIEEVVRHIDELGDEFAIVVYEEQELDCLRIVAEPRPEVPKSRHTALTEKIESEVRAKIGLRPEVELRPAGSLPKTELKARRLRDLRTIRR
jgi:phenylacetate-CoA ligase